MRIREYCLPFVNGAPGCVESPCRKRHDIKKCSCGIVLPLSDVSAHLRGQRHRDLLAQLQLQDGVQAAATGGYTQVQTLATDQQRMHCNICGQDIPTAKFEAHKTSLRHLRRKRTAEVEASLKEVASDKHGIIVDPSNGLDFGVVEAGLPGPRPLSLKIWRKDGACVKVFSFRLASGTSFSANISQSHPKDWVRGIRRPTVLDISFSPSDEGIHEDTIQILFFDVRLRQSFAIVRSLRATIGSLQDHEDLKPKAPYRKNKRILLQLTGPVIPAARPPTWTRVKWKVPLLEYQVPTTFARMFAGSEPQVRQVKGYVPSAFNLDTYEQRFKVLLWVEEKKMELDLNTYSMEDTPLTPKGDSYELYVKGLAEGRPTILVGDYVIVRHQGTEKPWYQGRVHKINECYLYLQFASDFSTYRGTQFDIRFVLNRLSLRRMYQALAITPKPARILFPGNEHEKPSRTLETVTPFNRLVAEDDEQWETVRTILSQPPGSLPFVIFGPPGTGKTVTIVEAIRQILHRDASARILACAPSNSAADLIAQRLMDLGRSSVFRLNSISRKFIDLPKTLRDFSLYNDNLVFAIPSCQSLQQYRVVVTTCVSAGVPYALGMKKGHFSHIFVDEAGQAKEPELMIPVLSLADPLTNLVIAGDVKQLGPVVHSHAAAALGLGQSYLVRIMNRDTHKLPEASGRTVVKLVKSFRSHPDILRFSNEHFYGGELQAHGNPAVTYSLVNSEILERKGFPILFHGVVGKDEREENNPSFFNVSEATIVKNYCMALVGNKKNRLRAEQMGIITPYHGQACKIRQLFRKESKLEGIKIGSVEEFQGDERRVIIISTVRSTTNYVDIDIRRHLGFVANPHRFNVAITRAQAMLIVIGNPSVLGLDPLWRSFLNYVHTSGGWKGTKPEWNPRDPVEPTGLDERARQAAAGKAEEMIAKLQALIVEASQEVDISLLDELEDSGGEEGENDREGVAFRRDGE